MEPTFIPAERSDIQVLFAMRREWYESEDWPFHDHLARAALGQLLDDRSLGNAWLIQLGDETVGYVVLTLGYSLEFHGRDAFVDELYVRSAYRGQGVGKRTLQFVADVCGLLGVHALHLEVLRDNRQAQSVYRQAGFEDRPHYLMTKRISPGPPRP